MMTAPRRPVTPPRQWPEVIGGTVYSSPGVPAVGVEIVAVNFEECRIIGIVTRTDAQGRWQARVSAGGIGCDLWVLDPRGCAPVLGLPVADDIVLSEYRHVEHIGDLCNYGPQKVDTPAASGTGGR